MGAAIKIPSASLIPEDECQSRCPGLVRETLELISGKWTAPIFILLHGASGPIRYAELQSAVGSITPKELARHLRRLEAAGLIVRRVHPTNPPRVDYELSDLGRSLYPAIESLAHWALNHREAVAENRRAYEAMNAERSWLTT